MGDAYDILKHYNSDIPLTESSFYRHIIYFREIFLSDRGYAERVARHRRPLALQNEILYELNNYIVQMQNRPEMRDEDYEKKISGFVPGAVTRIWESDDKVKSLFGALTEYCDKRDKDFTTTAIHMAEFRGLWILARLFNRAIRRGTVYVIK